MFSSQIQGVKVSMLLSLKGFQGRKSSDITNISKNKMVLVLIINHNISKFELLFSCEQKMYHLT